MNVTHAAFAAMAILLASAPCVHAAGGDSLIIARWNLNTDGTLAVSPDGSLWRNIAPVQLPVQAVYDEKTGLYRIRVQLGTIYVEGQSIAESTHPPCRTVGDSSPENQDVTSRAFGTCP